MESYTQYIKREMNKTQNYRGIMLWNITYKILAAVINYGLTPFAENLLGDYQNGFRASRGTLDNIQIMRQAFEKCYEYENYTTSL